MQVVHATGADWHCLVPSRKRLAYLKAGEMGRARMLRGNGKNVLRNLEQVIGEYILMRFVKRNHFTSHEIKEVYNLNIVYFIHVYHTYTEYKYIYI